MFKKFFEKMLKKSKGKKGFTLIEMLVVLVVVALLMAIIIPNVSGQKTRIEKQAAENIAEIVNTQYDTYALVNGTPTDGISLDMLLSDGLLTEKQVIEAEKKLDLNRAGAIKYPVSP